MILVIFLSSNAVFDASVLATSPLIAVIPPVYKCQAITVCAEDDGTSCTASHIFISVSLVEICGSSIAFHRAVPTVREIGCIVVSAIGGQSHAM